MAYLDQQLVFSDSQALTGSAASTNNIDLGQANRNIGIGEPMAVVIVVNVAAGGTTPTLAAQVQFDSTNGFGSAVSVDSGPAWSQSQLVAGARFVIPIDADLTLNEFVRVNYVMTGTSPTVTVTSYLTAMELLQAEQVGSTGYTVQ